MVDNDWIIVELSIRIAVMMGQATGNVLHMLLLCIAI